MTRSLISAAMMVSLAGGFALAQNDPGQGRDDQPAAQPGRVLIREGEQDAQNQADRQAQPAGQRQIDTAGRMNAGSQVQIDVNEKIKHLSSANELEIQISQHVQQNGEDAQVKQFAQQMVQDHQQARQRLQQVAQRKNVQVSEGQLMPYHQAKLDHFKSLRGAELDAAYSFDQAGHHLKATLEHQFLATHAQDQDLRQYALQTLPALQQHLQHVTQLAQGIAGMEGSAMPAGGRIGGQDGMDRNNLNRQQDRNRTPAQPGTREGEFDVGNGVQDGNR